MLQPKSKLPWFYNGSYDGTIHSKEEKIGDFVATQIYDEDSEYIVQACNNFPKAIELLNESKSFKRIADYEKWIKKVEEFLKSLEENGK